MTLEMPKKIMVYGEPEREIQVDVEPYHKDAIEYIRKDYPDELSDALYHIMKYPEIRAIIGSILSDSAIVALDKYGRNTIEGDS